MLKLKLILSAFILFAFFIYGCGKKETVETKANENKTQTNEQTKVIDNKGTEHVSINVASMQCGTCKKNIERAVKKVDGVIDVKVDKKEKVAHINFDKSKTDISKLENVITAAGYDANDKKADPEAYKNLDDCCKLPKDQKEKSDH